MVTTLVWSSSSLNCSLVVTIWSIGWHGPSDGVTIDRVVSVVLSDVLVVEAASVPVNMDVDVFDINSLGDYTGEVQLDISSLLERVWAVSGGGFIEGEYGSGISALRPGDGSGGEWLHISDGLEEALGHVELHEVHWVHDIEGGGVSVGVDGS